MDGHQRQRAQSAKMIEDGLMKLLEEKDFAKITVSEIVKKADVGRRTFYRLYEGKEDVLHRFFDRLCREYCDTCPPLERYDLARIAEEYFGFWYGYRKVLLLMMGAGLQEKLYYEICRVSEEVVKHRIMDEAVRDGEGTALFASYSTGGFVLLLHRWIAEGMEGSPAAYAQKISGALLQFIRPVGGNAEAQ